MHFTISQAFRRLQPRSTSNINPIPNQNLLLRINAQHAITLTLPRRPIPLNNLEIILLQQLHQEHLDLNTDECSTRTRMPSSAEPRGRVIDGCKLVFARLCVRGRSLLVEAQAVEAQGGREEGRVVRERVGGDEERGATWEVGAVGERDGLQNFTTEGSYQFSSIINPGNSIGEEREGYAPTPPLCKSIDSLITLSILISLVKLSTVYLLVVRVPNTFLISSLKIGMSSGCSAIPKTTWQRTRTLV
jgi:hypothetical protein